VQRHPLDTFEPHYPNRAERTADLVVHGLGLFGALVGGAVLLVWSLQAGDFGRAVAAGVYAVCLVAMLLASTVYNMSHPCAVRPLLRRLDEAAIFLLIAGSYTPFTTQLDGAWAFGMTGLIWAVGLIGVAAGCFIWPTCRSGSGAGVYIGMGLASGAGPEPADRSLP
jgi:hemolysin III